MVRNSQTFIRREAHSDRFGANILKRIWYELVDMISWRAILGLATYLLRDPHRHGL
jgi:hypothetical protein